MNQIIEPNRVYSYSEVMAILHIGEVTATKMVKEGKLKPVRLGKRKYIFTGSQILDVMKENVIGLPLSA